EREEIEPLVLAQRQAELGKEGGRVGLEDVDALDPAGPFLEVVVLEQLRQRDAERKGGEGEIQSFEPQRRQPKKETDQQAHRAGHRNGRPVRNAVLVHEDRRAVGADRVERTVPERDLAVEPGEDVQPEKGDGVNQHQRELEGAVFAHHERQCAGEGQHDCHSGEVARVHTRVTWTLPKKPEGFTVSTPMISTSATASFSSLPMTKAPSTFSRTPTRKPPNTAPAGLSMPPTSAAANA